MSDEIVMNEAILDETYKIYGCIGDLDIANQCANTLLEKLPDTYKGAGTTDLGENFYQKMMTHMNSLMMLYNAAFDFMINTYIAINGMDEAMANMMYRIAVDQGAIDPNQEQPAEKTTTRYRQSEPAQDDSGSEDETLAESEEAIAVDEEQIAAMNEFLEKYGADIEEIATRYNMGIEDVFNVMGKDVGNMTTEERQFYDEIIKLFSEEQTDSEVMNIFSKE